jgi:hypothetical protein
VLIYRWLTLILVTTGLARGEELLHVALEPQHVRRGHTAQRVRCSAVPAYPRERSLRHERTVLATALAQVRAGLRAVFHYLRH